MHYRIENIEPRRYDQAGGSWVASHQHKALQNRTVEVNGRELQGRAWQQLCQGECSAGMEPRAASQQAGVQCSSEESKGSSRLRQQRTEEETLRRQMTGGKTWGTHRFVWRSEEPLFTVVQVDHVHTLLNPE